MTYINYMSNSYNGHLCIVFALEHYNPLNMIRAFGENGINPVYISVKRWLAGASTFLNCIVWTPWRKATSC